MDLIPEFIKRRHGEVKIEYEHPLLEPISKETYGILVYQEQVMQAAQALAVRMMHARAGQLSLHLSWGGVLIGLVAWTVSAAIAAGLFAWTYNRLAPRASS